MVKLKYQIIFQKVLVFSEDREIVVDVVHYQQQSIATYQHWGFKIDASKGKAQYHWTEWPQQARDNYYGVYLSLPARKAA